MNRRVTPAFNLFRRCLSINTRVENPTLANVTHNTVSGRKRYYEHVDVAEVEDRKGYVSFFVFQSVIILFGILYL
mgnify:CR=1 FL=1